jgi:hypothetical protein
MWNFAHLVRFRELWRGLEPQVGVSRVQVARRRSSTDLVRVEHGDQVEAPPFRRDDQKTVTICQLLLVSLFHGRANARY